MSKNPFGLFRQFLQSAARIICSPKANKFHTCSLRSVFAHVHAAVENDFEPFSLLTQRTLRGFFTVWNSPEDDLPGSFLSALVLILVLVLLILLVFALLILVLIAILVVIHNVFLPK